MKRGLQVLAHIVLFILLTIITQVGGLVYIVCLLIFKCISIRLNSGWLKAISILVLYVLIYSFTSVLLVPPLAGHLANRQPLPYFGNKIIKPATLFTCACNRHFVTPELKDLAIESAKKMHIRHSGVSLIYLDANFPFINGFPLIPHLSHNDGKKLDLAFFYDNSETGEYTPNVPSPIGYGIHEEPIEKETNTATFCADNGYWNYDLIRHIIPQGSKTQYQFNKTLTKELLLIVLNDSRTGKVFLEPHLKDRLGLDQYPKLRFHGCHAVRHDDHIHIQL